MKATYRLVMVLFLFCLVLVCTACGGGGGGSGDDDDAGGDDNGSNDDDASGDDTSGGDDASTVDDDTASGDTWTDSSSGLTWQVTPSSDYNMTWDYAKSYCDSLPLAGGGWHLPTISDLRTLIRDCSATETGGTCGVKDSCLNSSCHDSSCNGCSLNGGPTSGCYWPSQLGGACYWYWSSSPVADFNTATWSVYFNYGGVHGYDIGYYTYARCVR